MKGMSYIMEFCPKCGSRLELRKSKVGKDFELVLTCGKCEYKKPETMKVRPKISKRIKTDPQKSVTIISKEDQKLTRFMQFDSTIEGWIVFSSIQLLNIRSMYMPFTNNSTVLSAKRILRTCIPID